MIELRDVTFAYPGKGAAHPVFSGLNLLVPRGRFVALMGPNGSGKSTLGKLVKGLLSPLSGEVWIGGERLAPGEISRRVGYVFSNPENQIVSSVVEEDVAFGLENLGVDPAEMARRVKESLGRVGMEEYRYHAPHLLSGGQQQKIILAGILAMESEILMLDEPTAMLDLEDRHQVMALVHQIHVQEGKTVLHITHALEEALLAQDILVLHSGQVSFFGPVDDFLTRKGLPFSPGEFAPISRLIHGLRERGHSIPLSVRSWEALRDHLLQNNHG